MSSEYQGFTLPDRRPLSEAEWQWIESLRSIFGADLPPVTLATAQALQIAFRR